MFTTTMSALDLWPIFQPFLTTGITILMGILIVMLIALLIVKTAGPNAKISRIIKAIVEACIDIQDNSDLGGEYQAKYLLTRYEWKNYQAMKDYAAGKGLIICPKIRLADLVEPRKGKSGSQWQSLFNRIKAKHVDFVLCDPDMHVKLIIELDDSTHELGERVQRDAFVDAVLTGAGYRIVHIHAFDDLGRDKVDAALSAVR